jgi:predicted amino acid-binding ACT domain protein
LQKVEADRCMAVDWSPERHTTYPAALTIECLDRIGIAHDILKKVSNFEVNLRDLKVETQRDKKTATIHLIMEVLDIEQLTRVAQSISQISDVLRVQRKDHRRRGSNGSGSGSQAAKTSNVTPLNSAKKRTDEAKSTRKNQKKAE